MLRHCKEGQNKRQSTEWKQKVYFNQEFFMGVLYHQGTLITHNLLVNTLTNLTITIGTGKKL